ncbi:MAG: PilZ domain-containing protein [Bdellovibrionota bacterium]|mgnify:CR=1 FL=1
MDFMSTRKVANGLADPFPMISFFPRTLRDELARRRLRLPLTFPSEVTVRLARSREDFEAALSLLDFRFTKYHALPSTTTLVVLVGEEIVGTASLIRSSSFGTPVDGHPDIAFLKESGSRLVTLSSFHVSPRFESRVLFPFLKGIFDYCTSSFGAEVLAVLGDARDMEFFESVLLFERLPRHFAGPIGILRMAKLHDTFARAYEKRPREQNLARFLALKTENIEIPNRPINKISDPVMTPELMREFFGERTDVFATLTDFEKQVLSDLYDSRDYQAVLPEPNRESRELVRRDKRFEVDLPTRVIVPSKGQINGTLRNVSEHGLLFDSERALREGEKYTFFFPLTPTKDVVIEGVILRNEVKRRYAIRIVNAPTEWSELIGYLENDLQRA